MLHYKNSIIPTIALFFRRNNDIDVFIEDSNDEEFYKTLLMRLVPENKISKIISCGCKTNLIEACEADQADRKRRRIYLADGDLDLVFDNNRKDLHHFFVLDRYCIENFLVNETGIVEVLHGCIVLDRSVIIKQLTLDSWLESISSYLIELFFHYSISHESQLGLKTVSIGVGTFCKQQPKNVHTLDFLKVEQKIDELKTEIISHIGQTAYLELITDRRSRWPLNSNTLLTIVSAKDYLLPLLAFRFKKLKGKVSFNLHFESLRIGLAKSCALDDLEPLRKVILNI